MTNKNELDEAVSQIHELLEEFRYRSGTCPVDSNNQKTPTGEGLDVNIVMMPDLLLDFRRKYLEGDGTNGERICAVGGRAARAACTLLHLLSDEDELFQCYLLTRTGNLGKLLLDNEFAVNQDGTPNNFFNAKYAPIIRIREGEPRCASREISRETSKEDVVSSPPKSNEELQPEHLDELKEILASAHCVYFASIAYPSFKELLNKVESLATKARIFLDLTRAGLHQAGGFDAFQVLSDLQKDKLEAVFIPIADCERMLNLQQCDKYTEKQAKTLFKKATAYYANYAKQKCIPMIFYGSQIDSIYYIDGHTEPVRVSSNDVDFRREDVPERFKAGVILATTVFHVNDVNKPVPIETIKPKEREVTLMYGEALALKPSGHRTTFCTLKPFLYSHDIVQKEHFSTNYPLQFKQSKNIHEFIDCEKMSRQIQSLASTRRMADWSRVKDFCFCDKHWCAQKCRQQNNTGIKPAILFDLDGTLIDSTKQRTRGLYSAFRVIADQLENSGSQNGYPSIDEMVTFFEKYVYGQWAIFDELGKGDFRQTWNGSGWYAAFLTLWKDRELLKGLTKWKIGGKKDLSWRSDFEDTYSDIEDKCEGLIRAAQEAFRDTKFYPLREAVELLKTLRDSDLFDLYVVSEGYVETQWEKLVRTGLNEFFNEDRLLTTQEAARPTKENDLTKAIEVLRVQGEQKSQQKKQLEFSQHKLQEVINDIYSKDIDDSAKDAVERIAQNKIHEIAKKIGEIGNEEQRICQQLETSKLVERVFQEMGRKKQKTFFAAAIRAILRDCVRPRRELTSFNSLLDEPFVYERARKFVIIGDRLSNDIVPLLELMGQDRILTIRILCGKYAEEELLEDQKPHYTIETLAQAKLILFRQDTWATIRCTEDPFIFNCDISVEDIDALGGDRLPIPLENLICGLEMTAPDFYVVRRVYGGILGEHLMHLHEENQRKFIDHCIKQDEVEDLVAECQRTLLVCAAIINTGAFGHIAEKNKNYIVELFYRVFRDALEFGEKNVDRRGELQEPLVEGKNAIRELGRLLLERNLLKRVEKLNDNILKLRDKCVWAGSILQ